MKRYQIILIGLIMLLISSRIYVQSQSTRVITAIVENETTLTRNQPVHTEQKIKIKTDNAIIDDKTNSISEDVTEKSPSNEIKSYYAYMRDGTKVAIEKFNQLSINELKNFSGIGDVTAAAIVSYRIENGGFNYYEELINVKGIGQKKLETLLHPSFD